MPTKKPRITAIVDQSTKDEVIAIAKDEKKSESTIAGRFLRHGMKYQLNHKPCNESEHLFKDCNLYNGFSLICSICGLLKK